MKPRTAKINRETKETSIKATVNLDGMGKTSIQTGISFLDHLVTSFAKHSVIDPVSYTHLTLPTILLV